MCTFGSFLIGNFDVLNVGRCALSQSYINLAERCMSLLNIGLYGLALERGHAGAFKKIISSCKTMKRLKDKSNEHQGLKETYLASLEKPRKILEDTFHFLELKGKCVKVFKPNKNVNEVVQTLNRIEPLITQENGIPHAQAKLTKFLSLHKYFEDNLIEGLYMLQFRKCEDETCCIRKKESLPPPAPAPVLSADGEHYLPFEDTCRKLSTTDRDCSSLQQKHNKPKPNTKQNFKFLGSRVAAVLECVQCKKPRCIFSMQSQLTPSNQRLLEDIIFTCGMLLNSKSIYTAANLNCNCLIENAYYGFKFTKLVCVHCGAR